MNRYIKIHPSDSVVVAILPLQQGEIIEGITLLEDIPEGHKIAICSLSEGSDVIKYGYAIGHVTESLCAGSWVNENNLKTDLTGLLDYKWNPSAISALPKKEDITFKGYRRSNGKVGVRNEIWIIPTVGCVNGIVNELAAQLREETHSKDVDAILAFPHNYGCSQLGDDHDNTRKILRDMVLHPNAGAVLIVGLGCENNQLEAFREFLGDYDTNRIEFMVAQQVEDEHLVGMSILHRLYAIASQDTRTDVPLSELKVGLKCGGSDGFSGITANPLLGVFSDFLVAHGGTTVLTEVPEMFGAETLLMNRCETKELFDKTVYLINDFKDYFIANKQSIYENPSPGNKTGGISTLEEKSLGCTQKSGSAAVKDVLMYGDVIKTNGLNLLSSPGNDLVASTALAASGCQLILFTTGRGTPFGSFVPTLKVSTNTALAKRKPNWIDFNAGSLLEGEMMGDLLAQFIRFIVDCASGKLANNERKYYREISIFKTGVTL